MNSNEISSIGAQYLGDALKINQVRRDLFRSNRFQTIRLFIDTGLTQSWMQSYWR